MDKDSFDPNDPLKPSPKRTLGIIRTCTTRTPDEAMDNAEKYALKMVGREDARVLPGTRALSSGEITHTKAGPGEEEIADDEGDVRAYTFDVHVTVGWPLDD